jgi:FtsH-binding integral membrane protein
MHSSSISIWFFIGVLLTVYGAMIFAYGLYELTLPQMAVANFHASIWWGAMMLALGLFYGLRFRPRRNQ